MVSTQSPRCFDFDITPRRYPHIAKMSASPDTNPIETAPSPGTPTHEEDVAVPADEGAQEEETGGEPIDQDAPATENPTEEGGEAEGETYVPATETTEARIPSFKKRSSAGAGEGDDTDDDDDDDEDRRRKKKKSRKDRRREEEEEEEVEPEMDEATRRRLALEERIDAIGKKQRVVRRKKRGGEDVDVSYQQGNSETNFRSSTRTTTRSVRACVTGWRRRPSATSLRTRTSFLRRASWRCWTRSSVCFRTRRCGPRSSTTRC